MDGLTLALFGHRRRHSTYTLRRRLPAAKGARVKLRAVAAPRGYKAEALGDDGGNP